MPFLKYLFGIDKLTDLAFLPALNWLFHEMWAVTQPKKPIIWDFFGKNQSMTSDMFFSVVLMWKNCIFCQKHTTPTNQQGNLLLQDIYATKIWPQMWICQAFLRRAQALGDLELLLLFACWNPQGVWQGTFFLTPPILNHSFGIPCLQYSVVVWWLINANQPLKLRLNGEILEFLNLHHVYCRAMMGDVSIW